MARVKRLACRRRPHRANRLLDMKNLLLWACALAAPAAATAQTLPQHWHLNAETHRLTIAGEDDNGFYDSGIIRELHLTFPAANYWSLLTQNYGTTNEVLAHLEVDGSVYDSVGVSFKGQTSYMMVNGQKKSFSIKLDAFVPGQDLLGYETLNLNNAFQDPSFLREFLYLQLIRKHVPAAKANFVRLFLNGEDWGLYVNVQQMNRDYLEEWFLSNNGTLWRADSPTGTGGGGPGGGGPNWGDGTAALNYLGTADSDYTPYYTLKSTDSTDPWQLLISTCDVLENTPIAGLEAALPAVMDVDRALWFLACENAFGDDDGYIFKGKMDYYVYVDAETGLLTPLEYDGNSVLVQETANWSPFYNANNANYPLINRLMQVPAYRQRYLAHLRTVVDELLGVSQTQGLLDVWSDFIDAQVQSDPKKIYTYANFVSEQTLLTTRFNQRRNALQTNAEFATAGPEISGTSMACAAGVWGTPLPGEPVTVTVASDAAEVRVYYSDALAGNFASVQAVASGGGWQAVLPGFPAGTAVRFYIEAKAAGAVGTRAYDPPGAEHDVYLYAVGAPTVASDIVVNELMAANTATVVDEAGDHADWIELFNRGAAAVDLTGYHLSDNPWNVTKWEMPVGTVMQPGAYLVVWADEDSAQGPLHANFKLSSAGEELRLYTPEGAVADEVVFGALLPDLGYARMPNGLGDFVLQDPTFAANNETAGTADLLAPTALLPYPNPARTAFSFAFNGNEATYRLTDATGRSVAHGRAVRSPATVDASTFAPGVYCLEVASAGVQQRAMLHIVN